MKENAKNLVYWDTSWILFSTRVFNAQRAVISVRNTEKVTAQNARQIIIYIKILIFAIESALQAHSQKMMEQILVTRVS